MKQRLVAIVAALSAAGLGAGAIVFVNWNDATIERVIVDVDGWTLMERDSCVPRACALTSCVQAQNHLTDAGSTCVPRLVACDWRITQGIRDAAAAAGVTLGPKKYQRLELGTLRCPGEDGGFTWTVPRADSGWPVIADVVPEVTPRCVRAPLDGGALCQRSERDGGFRYFGAGNVFLSSESNGHAQCEPCGCSVMYGDNPDVDL